MNELKPCPCCNGDARISERMIDNFRISGEIITTEQRYKIYCTNCPIETGWLCYLEDAEQAWNRREKS